MVSFTPLSGSSALPQAMGAAVSQTQQRFASPARAAAGDGIFCGCKHIPRLLTRLN